MTILLLCCTSRTGEMSCLSAQGCPSCPWSCYSSNVVAEDLMRKVLNHGLLSPSGAQDCQKHENGIENERGAENES